MTSGSMLGVWAAEVQIDSLRGLGTIGAEGLPVSAQKWHRHEPR